MRWNDSPRLLLSIPPALARCLVTLALVIAWLLPGGVVRAADQQPSAPAQPPASATPVYLPATFQGDPIAVKEYTLSNGLTVLISENHELPQVFGAVVVRAGGKNDPAHATGIAHYLEHMLFKGTQEMGTVDYAREAPHIARIEALYDQVRTAKDDQARARIIAEIEKESQAAGQYAIPNEFDRILSELGGTGVNAFTSPDITVYHNSFPAHAVERWIAIYAHRFQQPVFRMFQSELEAVYEEKNRSMDGFEPIAEVFLKKFFRQHPYGREMVLGSTEHLKNPSLTEMRKFYERYYIPGNMALVLAGDVDANAIMPVIAERFGAWEARPVQPFTPVDEAPFKGREQATVRMTPVRVAGLGFRAPPEGHPDYAAFLVCNELLSNPDQTGFLDQLARNNELLLTRAVPIPLNDHGIELVAFVPRIITQTFKGAERKVRAQFDKLRGGDFPDASFEAAKRAIINRHRLMWESNRQRALTMVNAFGRGQRWDNVIGFLGQLESLTKQDLVRVAARYFGDNFLVMRSRVGFPRPTRLEKPGFRPIKPASGARSPFYHQLETVPERSVTPHFVNFQGDIATALVSNNVHVEATGNPYNDIYSLELRYGIGHYDIRALSVLDEYLREVGTRTKGAQEFKHALWELATRVTYESTQERFIIRLTGPEQNLPAALKLVNEQLEAPADDRKALRRIRREIWGLGLVAKRQPAVIAEALREYVTFGEKSTYLQAWSARQLRGVKPRDLIKALQQARRYAVTARYAGNRTAGEVAALLRAGVRFDPQPRPPRPKVVRKRIKENKGKVFLVKRRQSVQSHVTMTVGGDRLAPAQRPRMHAFNEYFGGSMAGLVFQEIRELRSLAYSAAGTYIDHPVAGKPGLLWVRVQTQGDKTIEAMNQMVRLIRDLPEKPDRMESVRDALVHGQIAARPGFRQVQGVVERWRLQGYRADPRREWLSAYRGLSFDDIRGFHRDTIAGRPITVMIVGDTRRFDKQELGRFGDVVRVRVSDLFSK